MAQQPAEDESRVAHAALPTAPELPGHVAKAYGLHEHDPAVPAAAPDVPVPDQNDPLLENSETNAAVGDIAAEDSDALLAVDSPTPVVMSTKRGFWGTCKRPFVWWWRHKWVRYATVVALLAGLTAAVTIPASRYAILNTFGVRSEASVVAVDGITKLPLKNVTVTIGGQQVKTNVEGKASFTNLRLGPTKLTIKRVAFAPISQTITLGWGSNPLGNFSLTATGVQYPLQITDYLSGKPVVSAEVVSDEANALSDKKGSATITVDDTQDTMLAVTVQAEGYRTESLTLNAEATEPAKVALVPATKHAFIAKLNNKYDVYTIDLDGKNKQLLLAGTGLENSNLGLAMNTAGTRAALVSTRDNVRDKDGFLLTTLTVMNVSTGAAVGIEHGAQIQLLAWMGDRLVYRIAMPGASAANPNRYRIISYNTATNAKLQLTSANEFTASYATRGYVYYAASSTDPKAVMGLFKIKPDGSSKEHVFGKEVWTAFRSTYDSFVLQTPDEWYTYAIPAESAAITTVPANFSDYTYSSNEDETRSALVDKKDGKTSLMLYDVKTGKQTTLITQDGLAQPVHWAGGNALVYRIAIGTETADYAISPAGGPAHKITDAVVSYGASSP